MCKQLFKFGNLLIQFVFSHSVYVAGPRLLRLRLASFGSERCMAGHACRNLHFGSIVGLVVYRHKKPEAQVNLRGTPSDIYAEDDLLPSRCGACLSRRHVGLHWTRGDLPVRDKLRREKNPHNLPQTNKPPQILTPTFLQSHGLLGWVRNRTPLLPLRRLRAPLYPRPFTMSPATSLHHYLSKIHPTFKSLEGSPDLNFRKTKTCLNKSFQAAISPHGFAYSNSAPSRRNNSVATSALHSPMMTTETRSPWSPNEILFPSPCGSPLEKLKSDTPQRNEIARVVYYNNASNRAAKNSGLGYLKDITGKRAL
jgi:hypothetical protein